MNKNHNVDPHRSGRTNIPEVVLARFKDDESLLGAINGLLPGGRVLVTKCSEAQLEFLNGNYQQRVERFDKVSGTMIISDGGQQPVIIGSIAILSAGSSDYYVAEEASISAEYLGLEVHRFYDCGVAGFHRVDEALKIIGDNQVDAVIVVAGMEGALPSVIASRIKQPMIAVPTSVGYGTSYDGIAALLSMMNSCAPGISVVNIDNGFGAAVCTFKMMKWVKDK
ncbi:MAG: nickel pincer cofactor biosynthesis protein LarB [Thermoplasmata archaeon]|nr:nickel pincer cofactor biosynthesis protein LarB [Thermoplasmata archaeon]